MRRGTVPVRRTLGWATVALLVVSLTASAGEQAAGAAEVTVRFGAAGDFGAAAGTTNYVLRSVGAAAPDLFLGLGDNSYDVESPQAWCQRVKDQLNAGAGRPAGDPFGETYPFEAMAGNHETTTADAYAACLPDRLGAVGGPTGFGRQFVLDYPAGAPLVRFVMAGSRALTPYAAGSANLAWVSNSIDAARAAGIRWVVVGVHENYIGAGTTNDEIGPALFTLLLDKKVDLVLMGHDHNYQRSKQLVTGGGCPVLPTNRVLSPCVVNDGGTGRFAKGRGPVVLIVGTGGRSTYAASLADSEGGYFATVGVSTYGWSSFTVTPSRLTQSFVRTGGAAYTDGFTIDSAGPDAPGTDVTSPTAVPAPAITAVTDSSVSLGWPAGTDGTGVAGYRILRDGVEVGSTPGTAFTDTGLAAGGTYAYSVIAYDAAGNAATPSPVSSLRLAPTTTLTFAPSHDTRVESANPSTTFGTATTLRALGGSATERAYFTVPVTGVAGRRVVAAALRLTVADASGNGGLVSSTTTGWAESTLTWSAAPAPGTSRAQLGSVALGDVVLPDVTAAVPGDGSYGFAVTSTSGDRVAYYSKEYATTANRPTLVLTVAPNDASAPTAAGAPAATVLSAQRVDLAWPAATDDVGVSGYRVLRNGTVVATVAGTSWSDTTVTPSTGYSYAVQAFDGTGRTGPLSPSTAATTPAAPDVTAPTPPTTLAAVVTTSSAALSWAAATDDVAVTGYQISRDGAAAATVATPGWTDSGLAAGSTHLYSVVAVDAAGNASVPATLAVTMAQSAPDTTPPTVPGAPVAGTLTPTAVPLSWAASSDGGGLAGYDVLRDGTVVATVAAGAGPAWTDTTMIDGRAYDYTVVAVDLTGNRSAASPATTVQVPPADTPPSAPGTPTATAVGSTTVTLAWPAAGDDVAVAQYRLVRDGVVVATVAGPTATDTGLAPATAYTYRVRAVDSAGQVGPDSPPLTVTTTAVDAPPSAPGTPVTTVVSPTRVDLDWAPATDDHGVTRYDVLRDATLVAQVSSPGWSDTGLAERTTYTWTVRAVDSAGQVGPASAGATVTTPAVDRPPAAPDELGAPVVAADHVDLGWDAAVDDLGVASYRVVRGGVVIGSTTGTTFTDVTVAPQTSYTYTVRAVDTAGQVGPDATPVTVTTPTAFLPDTSPPSAPGGLTATAGSPTSALLAWTPATDDRAVVDYVVRRGGTVLATVTGTTYTDPGLTGGTTYGYSVVARDAAGNVGPPATATVSTPPVDLPPTAPASLTATAVSPSQIDLAWPAATDDVAVTGYQVLRGGVSVGTTTTTRFSDPGRTAATAYSYTVRGVDGAGQVGPASPSATTRTFAVLTLALTADATIRQAKPTTKYGSAKTVEVEGSPVIDLVATWSVTGTAGSSVARAVLRQKVTNATVGASTLFATGTGWAESTVTWGTAPAATGPVLATIPTGAVGAWVETDLTGFVTGDGSYAVRVSSTSSDYAAYSSREAGASSAPQLVLWTR